jgi:hypothetical protein
MKAKSKIIKHVNPRLNYLGNDPAKFIHSNKTHRSASEAFRDADYAQAIWSDHSELADFIEWCRDMKIVFPLLTLFIVAIVYVLRTMP